jgi:hypothetical protein
VNVHTGAARDAASNLPAVLRSGPFEEALHAAIAARGLSLERLRSHLSARGIQVGTATLSCWQNGHRRPERPDSLRAVSALEEILGLPADALLVLLGPRRPRGPSAGLPQGSRAYRQLMPDWPVVEELIASLDTTADDKLHIAAQHELVWIDGARSCARRETFQVLRAHQDGVDRYIAITTADPGADIDQVDLRALENCRVGRVRRDRDAGLLISELLFDLVLGIGQTHLIRYEVLDTSGAECDDYHRGFRFPAGQYALQVRFDPARLPVACFAYEGRQARELTMTGYRSVHVNVAPVPPGNVGIRWEWDGG